MKHSEHERYRQVLIEVLQNCNGRSHAGDEAALHADINEVAVMNHACYITDRKEQIRFNTCEAARRALARLEEGEFGLCVDCGEDISPKRLIAVPWTECCVDCQERREQAQPLRRAA